MASVKMAGFPPEFIQELKSRNDIVSVISQYVPLTRKGSKYFCCCPFHNEKTPSMCVNTDGQYYHCFGCGVTGDIITFIMEMESLAYPDAVKLLADRANLTLPEYRGDADHAKKQERGERLRGMMRDAAVYYNANLKRESTGAEARAYLDGRGIGTDIRTRFGLGLSLGYDEMPGYMRRKGYSLRELEDCGLIVGDRHGDAFAGRIIVPIFDGRGNVVAFGGRIYRGEKDVAKYKNSTNTVLFDKGRTLYGANFVRKDKRERKTVDSVILVEGYMDVIALAAGGFTNAVAGMGTALTPRQAKEIKRLAPRVFVCYDGDDAGRHAAIKNVDILAAEGLDISVVSLPDGADPDDAVRKLGADAFRRMLEEALPVMEYKLKVCADSHDLTSADGRAAYVKAALALLAPLESNAEREVYYNEMSAKSGVSVKTLAEQFAGKGSAPARRQPAPGRVKEDAREIRAARYALGAMIARAPFANFEDAEAEWMPEGALRGIYELAAKDRDALFASERDAAVDARELSAALAAYETDTFTGDKEAERRQNYYRDCLVILANRHLEAEAARLTAAWKAETDKERKRELLGEITVIMTKIRSKDPSDKRV